MSKKNPGPGRSSGRTQRAGSSNQHQQEDEPSLENVVSMLTNLTSMFGELQADFRNLKDMVVGLKDEVRDLKEEVRDLKDEVIGLQRANDDLFNENEELRLRLADAERVAEDLERHSKKNNLLFFGLPRQKDDSPEKCEEMIQDFLVDKLGLTCDTQFERVHHLGNSANAPVFAQCTFYKQKVMILKAKRKLKELNSKVFIREDFSRRVRETRKQLMPFLKEARQQGKRATLLFDTLLIDGKKYDVDNEGELVVRK